MNVLAQKKRVVALADRSAALTRQRKAHAAAARDAAHEVLSSPAGLSWSFAAGAFVASGQRSSQAPRSRLSRLVSAVMLANRFLNLPLDAAQNTSPID